MGLDNFKVPSIMTSSQKHQSRRWQEQQNAVLREEKERRDASEMKQQRNQQDLHTQSATR